MLSLNGRFLMFSIMQRRRIANEIMREIPRENVLSLVQQCAVGLGYWAHPAFPKDVRQVSEISLFANDTRDLKEISPEGEKGLSPSLAGISITPIPPNMRIEVWCTVDWQMAYRHLGNTPCEIAFEIIRFLLRKIEGDKRAGAWLPVENATVTDQARIEGVFPADPISVDHQVYEYFRIPKVSSIGVSAQRLVEDGIVKYLVHRPTEEGNLSFKIEHLHFGRGLVRLIFWGPIYAKLELHNFFEDVMSYLRIIMDEPSAHVSNSLHEHESTIKGKSEMAIENDVFVSRPQARTIDAIKRLMNIREKDIKELGIVPTWVSTCDRAGIRPETAKKYISELHAKWEDKKFRPDPEKCEFC